MSSSNLEETNDEQAKLLDHADSTANAKKSSNLEKNLSKEKLIEPRKLRIAIIGAGISGCASAYFLKQHFDENAEITMFEKSDQVGGRLSLVTFEERDYELGGSVIHPSNLYMKTFVKNLGLEKKEDESSFDECLGIFDKNGIIVKKTGNFFGIVDSFNFAKRYGFFQLYKFKQLVQGFVDKFSKIYKLQENGYTFLTLEEFLKKLDPNLYKASQTSLRNLLNEKKFNSRIINELASIACLTNYGQSIDIDAFVGLISIAGGFDELWSVKNGNKNVPVKLLEYSKANVLLNSKVKAIRKNPENRLKNQVVYLNENDEEVCDNDFDYVLIGFPITKGTINENFQIESEKLKQFDELEMNITNTYVIYGKFKLFPELPNNKRVQALGIDPELALRSISVILPCNFSKKSDRDLYLDANKPKLYKIFADRQLDKKDLEKIFENDYKLITMMPWPAYPKYKTNSQVKTLPDIVLDDKETASIYYLNALEWASSCMEISCISARNVSLLIAQKEQQQLQQSKPKRKRFFTQSDLQSDYFFEKKLHKICGLFTFVSIFAFLYSFYFNNSN